MCLEIVRNRGLENGNCCNVCNCFEYVVNGRFSKRGRFENVNIIDVILKCDNCKHFF